MAAAQSKSTPSLNPIQLKAQTKDLLLPPIDTLQSVKGKDKGLSMHSKELESIWKWLKTIVNKITIWNKETNLSYHN